MVVWKGEGELFSASVCICFSIKRGEQLATLRSVLEAVIIIFSAFKL